MLKKNNKYYIEFIGAHGAGKSFLCKGIAKQQPLHSFNIIHPSNVRRPKLHFILSCPIIAIKNIKHILFVISYFFYYTKLKIINLKVLRSLLKMIILHQYYYRFNYDILLKDDMLHMLQRIVFKPKIEIETAFKAYFTHFSYLYDGLVFVCIDHDTIKERFKYRFKGKSESFKNIRKLIHERAFHQSKILRKVISSQNLIPFILVDGTNDLQMNSDKIISFINNKIIRK